MSVVDGHLATKIVPLPGCVNVDGCFRLCNEVLMPFELISVHSFALKHPIIDVERCHHCLAALNGRKERKHQKKAPLLLNVGC